MTSVVTAPLEVAPGRPAIGFDTPRIVTDKVARAFFGHGYRFCIRYVRRDPPHKRELKRDEADRLLAAGLALMPVQYVESTSENKPWVANGEKGVRNGATGAEHARLAGLPEDVTLWCDLENVSPASSAADVVAYCNRWFEEVDAARFKPGLYVGFRPGLGPKQLFQHLRFTAYWGAYNLNKDEEPIVRGLQMKQHEAKAGNRPKGLESYDFQTDTVRTDGRGDRPAWVQPDGWPGPV